MVDALLQTRPLDRLRSVQALLRLVEQVGKTRVEAACARAQHYGDPSYRRIKDILNAALDQQPLPAATPAAVTDTPYAFERAASEFFGAEAHGC